MEELFQRLESRIQKLLQKSAYHKAVSQSFQQGKMSLAQENERLLNKQKGVAAQIENIVLRLKTQEGL